MPIQLYEKNQGFGDLAQALVSAPAIYMQGKRQAQDRARTRARDVAGIQKSMADARKTMLETQQLEDQRRYQAGLPQDLDTLDAYRSERQRPIAPPALGSASSPLEADINESLRGNQDLFASTAVPSPQEANESLANLVRGFGGNAAQVTDAVGNVQGQNLTAEAADAARGGIYDLSAALNAAASGGSMPAIYDQNAGGGVLNRYTGELDLSNPLAGANIDAERALAEQRRASEASLTPQDKQYAALQKLNQAYVEAGLPPMDEVTMREIAAGHLQTFNDPLGLTRVIYDPARRQIVGTVDEKSGFQPFQPDAPAPTGDGQSWGEWLSSWMPGFGGGGDGSGAVPAATDVPEPAGPGAWSPVLRRNVTEAEIEATAENRGITTQQVRQRLGIE